MCEINEIPKKVAYGKKNIYMMQFIIPFFYESYTFFQLFRLGLKLGLCVVDLGCYASQIS